MKVDFNVIEGSIEGRPDVIHIDYDLERLVVLFEPDSDIVPIKVIFDNPAGFRVLDEEDLLEFWGRFNLKDGWLFRISSGGWRDLESKRSGFVTALFDDVQEYLIISENICVSVLAASQPKVLKNSPNKRL